MQRIDRDELKQVLAEILSPLIEKAVAKALRKVPRVRPRKSTGAAFPVEGVASVLDAAKFLQCSDDTVYRMVAANEISFSRIRGLIRIPWAALHEMTAAK